MTGWRGLIAAPQRAEAITHQDGASAGTAAGPQAGASAAPGQPAAGAAGTAGAHRHGRGQRRALPAAMPLLAVLAVQAVLSLRLLRSSTAFQDEALYLWAGHLQWAHWLHGMPLPPYPAYFSGAPVLYPPLGALADSAGGLIGARALSLAFMLGATALLWGTARRLFGRRAAFFAAALFAVAGPTLHLGAFATYDALSVLLIALAAWCAVRAGDRQDATAWMVAAGAALALANAAAYASALFDPVVVLLALTAAYPRPGGKPAAARAATLLTVLAALLTAGLLLGGRSYLTGIQQTTLARAPGTDSPLTVLAHAWSWTAVIVAAAVGGAIARWLRRPKEPRTWMLTLLAGAALLVPLEQASLHTLASLNKHVGLGAWFAAIAAGYAADKLLSAAPAGRSRLITSTACVIALAYPAALGATQAAAFATSWPSASSFIAILRPLAARTTGRLLVEDPSIAEYYLPAGHQWQRWSGTRNIILPDGTSTGGPTRAAGVTGAGDPAIYARFIARGYFTLVALNYADTTALDHALARDLRRSHHYKTIQVIPYGHGTYVIWRYDPHLVSTPGYTPRLGTHLHPDHTRNHP